MNRDGETSAKLLELTQRVEALKKENKRMKYRLKLLIPLFQEARDALPAISLATAKMRNLDLTLADRMDEVGTMTAEAIDKAINQPT